MPRHVSHGSLTMVPWPRQTLQVLVRMNWPNPPRLETSRMRPLPWHCGHCSRPVPAWRRCRRRSRTTTSAVTSTSLVTPNTASAKVRSSRDLDVVAARRGRAAARRAPHPAGVAQHRVEHAAAEEDVEEVAEADVLEVGHLAAAQAVEAVVVVGGARVGVAEHLVGLRRLLELRLGLRVLRVHVRVALARQLAEGLLDLAGVGVAAHAEHVVVVTLQWSPQSEVVTRSLRGRR